MAVKLFTIMLALLCAFQLYEAARLARSPDTPQELLNKAGDSISRTFGNVKESVKDFVKSVPSAETVVHNITSGVKSISDRVGSAAKDLVSRVSSSSVKIDM